MLYFYLTPSANKSRYKKWGFFFISHLFIVNKLQLVWFKKDLRINDHLPLISASKNGPCLCLYIYEDELINADDFANQHFQFLSQSLRELRKS
ncbi:MAG: hypothetical protein CMO54_10675, partial [Verrucomicrobiales bacterium]|nr:hypothetical protein [Verrucomicrobiales bacterium]